MLKNIVYAILVVSQESRYKQQQQQQERNNMLYILVACHEGSYTYFYLYQFDSAAPTIETTMKLNDFQMRTMFHKCIKNNQEGFSKMKICEICCAVPEDYTFQLDTEILNE